MTAPTKATTTALPLRPAPAWIAAFRYATNAAAWRNHGHGPHLVDWLQDEGPTDATRRKLAGILAAHVRESVGRFDFHDEPRLNAILARAEAFAAGESIEADEVEGIDRGIREMLEKAGEGAKPKGARGMTWDQFAQLRFAMDAACAVLTCASGTLMGAVLEVRHYVHNLLQLEADDGGSTWSAVRSGLLEKFPDPPVGFAEPLPPTYHH